MYVSNRAVHGEITVTCYYVYSQSALGYAMNFYFLKKGYTKAIKLQLLKWDQQFGVAENLV